MHYSRHRKKDQGAWQIQRERLHLTDQLPPPPERTHSLDELLKELAPRMGLASAEQHDPLAESWPGIVGEQLAAQTRPARVRHNTLIVYVKNSVWLNELSRYRKDDVLAAVRERSGRTDIRTLRFQLDPDPP